MSVKLCRICLEATATSEFYDTDVDPMFCDYEGVIENLTEQVANALKELEDKE
jgi:hypothetical protein